MKVAILCHDQRVDKRADDRIFSIYRVVLNIYSNRRTESDPVFFVAAAQTIIPLENTERKVKSYVFPL